MTATLIASAMALVFVETLFLWGLVKAADRYLPGHWIRERHDLALTAVLMVPLLMALTMMPGSGPGQPVTPLAPPAAERDLPPAGDTLTAWLPASDAAAGGTAGQDTAAGERTLTLSRLMRSLSWLALVLWMAGSLVALTRVLHALGELRGLVRGSEPVALPAAMHLSYPIVVRRSKDVSAPMLVGYLNPAVLVPSAFSADARALPVLEHEIAHARRGDNWITLAVRLIRAAFWWNLPLRWLEPVLFATREQLCDSRAAAVTGSPRALAHALLDVARTMAQAPQRQMLAAEARGHALEARIRRLVQADAVFARAPTVTVMTILPVLAITAVLTVPSIGRAQSSAQASDAPERLAESAAGGAIRADRVNEPLYFAAARGELETVIAMIRSGYDPSRASRGDGTPLMGAIRGGHRQVVEALLSYGADPNVKSHGDGTALIAAVRAGSTSTIDLLLSAGADPNLGVSGDGNPLIVAAGAGRLAIVEQLLAAGADVNAGVRGDGNALIGAALGQQPVVIRRLLSAGADPNGFVYGDETPLVNAAQTGNIEIAELLVSAGADVSLTVPTPRGDHRSPLSEARRKGHVEMISWLEARGAEHRPRSDQGLQQ